MQCVTNGIIHDPRVQPMNGDRPPKPAARQVLAAILARAQVALGESGTDDVPEAIWSTLSALRTVHETLRVCEDMLATNLLKYAASHDLPEPFPSLAAEVRNVALAARINGKRSFFGAF